MQNAEAAHLQRMRTDIDDFLSNRVSKPAREDAATVARKSLDAWLARAEMEGV